MAVLPPDVKWGRVVAAGVAAHFIDDFIFAVVPFSGWFLGPVGFWVTPALTAALAVWVARTVPETAAVQYGLLVGAVSAAIALIVGLPGLALVPAAIMVGAGLAGGLLGRQWRPAVDGTPSHPQVRG